MIERRRPGVQILAAVIAGGLSLSAPAFAQGWEDAAAAGEPAQPDEAQPAPAAESPSAPAAEPTKAAASQEPDAKPKIDVTGPPPEPPVARSFHVHDGFYLRINLGIGAYGAKYENDVTAGGGALSLDALVGGTPTPGLVLGGALLADHVQKATVEQDGRDIGDAIVETGMFGAFIDGFPDAKGGFHLGGALGFANIHTDVDGADEVRDDTGFGGAVWVGYDAWVGDEWSLGALLRVSAAIGKSEKDGQDRDAESRALTLMFTALYH